MNIFGIGLPEMILILLVALLIFGPKKLPEIGRSMGKAIKGFQDASREFESEFKKEADRLEQIPTASVATTTPIPQTEPPTVEVVSTPVAVETNEETKQVMIAADV